MSNSTCDSCGDKLQDPRDKDKGGWWRDRCMDCIAEESDLEPRDDPTEEYVL